MSPISNEKSYFVDRDCLVQDLSRVYRKELFGDISFVLMDGVSIVTNRFMLASRSDYFATMLYGGLKEGASDKVDLQCNSSTFRLILDYVWEGKVDFSQMNRCALLDLLENARMMCLDRLFMGIEDYIKDLLKNEEIKIKECLVMLEFCVNNKFEDLGKLVLQLVDLRFEEVNIDTDFCELSDGSVLAFLKYQERSTREIDMFKAIASWIKNHETSLATKVSEEMLSMVNLVKIKACDLIKIVRKTSLFDDKTICDALDKMFDKENENVCLASNGARLVEGIIRNTNDNCIREPPYNFCDRDGYTFNELDQRITVELKNEYMINKVQFLLWDRDDRTYSYALQSSLDGLTWTTLLDCTEYECKSLQTIFFEAKHMKFISVQGTRNSYTRDDEGYNFHIVSMLASFDNSTKNRENTGMQHAL